MNVIVNVLIARGYQPGKQFSLSTMTLDILSPQPGLPVGWIQQPFFLPCSCRDHQRRAVWRDGQLHLSARHLHIYSLLAAASRGELLCRPNATIGKMFLFLVVALTTIHDARARARTACRRRARGAG